jgi:hypothetical protein
LYATTRLSSSATLVKNRHVEELKGGIRRRHATAQSAGSVCDGVVKHSDSYRTGCAAAPRRPANRHISGKGAQQRADVVAERRVL